MDREQAIKIADAFESIEKEKLRALREKRARPPSFWYAVPGLRALPSYLQEELFDQAKWRAFKNWRFVAVAAVTILLQISVLWWLFRHPLWESGPAILLASTVLPGLMTLASIPLVRAELRALVRSHSEARHPGVGELK